MCVRILIRLISGSVNYLICFLVFFLSGFVCQYSVQVLEEATTFLCFFFFLVLCVSDLPYFRQCQLLDLLELLFLADKEKRSTGFKYYPSMLGEHVLFSYA